MTIAKTELVNSERIFGVVKRLFTGNPDEILGEMLQNAQRAGATCFDVRIEGDRISFSDNGKGIDDDLEGFRNLLSIADSRYSKEVEIEQSPMGVGFYALLSHADVSEVRVETGGKLLAIDTRRWFADAAYRQIWPDLLGPSSIRTGMVIEAICGEKLLHEFGCLLKEEWWTSRVILRIPPWVGYGKLLSVTCNGTRLPSELPKFLTLEPLIETEYLGNRLTIGFSPEKNHQFSGSFVNWFGQFVSIYGLGDGLNLHLEVTGNNPVTPQSPTRSGIVQDEKWDAFKGFVRKCLRDFFEGLTALPSVRVLEAAYRLFPDLTKSLPWLVVRPAKPGGGCDFDDRFARTVSEIVPKDGDFLLLEGEIEVFDDEDESETSEGLEAFLPLLDKPAYFLEQGSAPVLAIAWKPGPLVRNDLGVEIRERGHFSLVGKTAPTDWKPVTEDVYAFMNPVAWDIQEAQLIVGATDPVATIWAAADAIFEHDHNIEDSWETTNHCFKESVGDVVRQLLGNVVPKNFSRNDLLEFVPKEELLERVEFIREIDGLKGLRLVFASGNHRELGFY